MESSDRAPAAPLTFAGDVVVVTGAGSGIGRSHALELARRGARVVVNDIGVDQSGRSAATPVAQATVDAIVAAGGEAVASLDSVAEADGAAAIVATALDTWGQVDAVVHNAGFSRDNHFELMTPDEWHSVLDVHLNGCFYLAQSAYRAMKDGGRGGRFVFTTSTGGLLGAPLMSNYGAGKMGVVGLARSIALEGERHGIKANALSPGAVTQRAEDPHAFRFANRADPIDPSTQPGMDQLTPERVSPMVVVLSHRSCPVTGQILMARAGWFARAWVAASPGWIADPGEVAAEQLVEHWDEIYGATPCADELPLDGPGWASRFMFERVKPMLDAQPRATP
ncbi:SDR family NAD(P)-dependent oxidoreductase [Trujillonella endophytica]|uniref:SDR family NAD(P)-dependent oxidoreductase n=1 Tax=Trujillonella endophytica TaxID=673521 RepID=UPI00148061D7|nr:SDR family NAD(P)-dependent oxidoreductase [Trujillella endophytica]